MSRDDADGQTMGFRNSDEVRNFQDKSMTTPSHTELAARIYAIAGFLIMSVNAQQDHPEEPPQYATEFDMQLEQAGHELSEIARAMESPERVRGEAVAWYEYHPDHDAWFLAYTRNPKAKTRPLIFGDAVVATPSPQAEKQPLSEADEALMRQALDALQWEISGYRKDGMPDNTSAAITALRARLETKK